MKRCPNCTEVKSDERFGLRHDRPTLRSWCKKCSANHANVSKKLWRDRNVQRLGELKVATGCLDCGYNAHPEALQFDHVSGVKEMDVCKMTGMRWERIEAEIAKCEVVCANCHAVRTAERRTTRKEVADDTQPSSRVTTDQR